MKALALALAAIFPLLACSEGAAPDDHAQAEANNAVEVAAVGNDATPPAAGTEPGAAGDADKAAATPPRDAPIKDGRSRASRPPPAGEADQCGASRYQWLVGRPRSAIPPQPERARWRVTCTGCPITMDYSPARLNVFYDSETERVEEVRCG